MHTISGTEFAVCPFGRQQRMVAVEQATDSSRNFVLRLEDRATKRHAFVGLSFAERNEAFDFNVALVRAMHTQTISPHLPQSDFDKHLERAEAVKTVATSPASVPAAGPPPPGSLNGRDVLQEASVLYKKQDLSLKDGQTIKCAFAVCCCNHAPTLTQGQRQASRGTGTNIKQWVFESPSTKHSERTGTTTRERTGTTTHGGTGAAQETCTHAMHHIRAAAGPSRSGARTSTATAAGVGNL